MTVGSYLNYIAGQAYVRDEEKQSIRNSITNLQSRLVRNFGTEISQQLIFGSYSRDTILPRSMDESSDIDYMIIFRDGSLRPQSYLDKLRRFVETSYSRSEIQQSNPTIQLSLNHIRFELVPATQHLFYGIQIPAKASSSDDWICTDPVGLNKKLTEKNQSHGNFIKPLIRIVKYWNAQNGKVFDSYDLEKKILEFSFFGSGFFCAPNLEAYFFEFMSSLDVSWFAPDWKQQKIKRMKQIINTMSQYKSSNMAIAEQELRKLLPAPTTGLFGLGRSSLLGGLS
jgi:predicted nucleotidyltransferase